VPFLYKKHKKLSKLGNHPTCFICFFPENPKKNCREISFSAPQKKDLLALRKKTFSLSGIKRLPCGNKGLSTPYGFIIFILLYVLYPIRIKRIQRTMDSFSFIVFSYRGIGLGVILFIILFNNWDNLFIYCGVAGLYYRSKFLRSIRSCCLSPSQYSRSS